MSDKEKAIEYAKAIKEAPSRSMAKRLGMIHETTLADVLLAEVERVKELEAKLEKKETEWQDYFEANCRALKKCADAAEAKLAKAVEALEFYSEGSWDGIKSPKFVFDKGDTARACLAELRAE